MPDRISHGTTSNCVPPANTAIGTARDHDTPIRTEAHGNHIVAVSKWFTLGLASFQIP